MVGAERDRNGGSDTSVRRKGGASHILGYLIGVQNRKADSGCVLRTEFFNRIGRLQSFTMVLSTQTRQPVAALAIDPWQPED